MALVVLSFWLLKVISHHFSTSLLRSSIWFSCLFYFFLLSHFLCLSTFFLSLISFLPFSQKLRVAWEAEIRVFYVRWKMDSPTSRVFTFSCFFLASSRRLLIFFDKMTHRFFFIQKFDLNVSWTNLLPWTLSLIGPLQIKWIPRLSNLVLYYVVGCLCSLCWGKGSCS